MPTEDPAVGLCATCRHCRIVQSARSTFHLCELSFVDERFRKYPPLPVVRCGGYEPGRNAEPPAPDEPPFDRGKS
jgi:hypothetical protein